MYRKILAASLFCFMFIFSLSPGQLVQAAESSPLERTFTPLVYEPLNARLSDVCQATETTLQNWLFELPVTQELLTELQNNATEGGTVTVEFATMTDVIIEGNGRVAENLNVELVILDDSSGQEIVQASHQMTVLYTVTGPHHDGFRLTQVLDAGDIAGLESGDALLMKTAIEVTLQAAGCNQSGQTPVLSVRKRVDSASPPLLTLLAGLEDIPGVEN